MDELKIVKSRLVEKAKIQKAKQQILWLFLFSSSIIFCTLLFVWSKIVTTETNIPSVYFLSTLLIIFSSYAIVFAKKAIQKNDLNKAHIYVSTTILLGIGFTFMQVIGWQKLFEMDLNSQILLPFTFIHFLHIVVGLFLLGIILRRLKNYQIHSKEAFFSNNIFYFWHFLGVIWVGFLIIVI